VPIRPAAGSAAADVDAGAAALLAGLLLGCFAEPDLLEQAEKPMAATAAKLTAATCLPERCVIAQNSFVSTAFAARICRPMRFGVGACPDGFILNGGAWNAAAGRTAQ
jgi:hypothetical protein